MTTEIQTQSNSIVPVDGGNFELSAQNPQEMVKCHETAIEWCRNKIQLVRNEHSELQAAYEHAVERKWKSAILKKHANLAKGRVVFYEKMLSAFEAGYYIVPNFPCTVFAIRTDRSRPKPDYRIACCYDPRMTQEGELLPQGEGEYKNPEPLVEVRCERKNDRQVTVRDYRAIEWQKIEFPANMARLHVMQASTRAMALKVFDEVCMLPSDRKRHADPILIGRIKAPKKYTHAEQQVVSFMIAWHIDTKTL